MTQPRTATGRRGAASGATATASACSHHLRRRRRSTKMRPASSAFIDFESTESNKSVVTKKNNEKEKGTDRERDIGIIEVTTRNERGMAVTGGRTTVLCESPRMNSGPQAHQPQMRKSSSNIPHRSTRFRHLWGRRRGGGGDRGKRGWRTKQVVCQHGKRQPSISASTSPPPTSY